MQIALWVGQWLLIEIAKKWPGAGEWIKNNAPPVVALLAVIVTYLQSLLGTAHAQAIDSLAGSDSLAVVTTVVPVYVAGGLIGWIGNVAGSILADNVLRKIIWHYIFGKVLKIKQAQLQ